MLARAFLLFSGRPHATLCYFALIVTPMLRLCRDMVKSWAGFLLTLQNCFWRYSNVNKLKRFKII